MNTTVVLPSPNSPSKPLPLTLSGYPKEVGGFPAFYARKEILKCGDYVHPSTGLKFSITPQRIDGLVQSFKKMQERGHKVFLPGKHRDYDAKDNFGWAIAMERQGDSLYAVEQLIGEDAKLTAARNDRSVLIRPNFKDEQGNEYPEAIEHVALCPDPVISGMSGTVPIAASKSSPATEALVLELAARQETPMDLSPIRKALGLADDAPDADVVSKAAAKLGENATALSREGEAKKVAEKDRDDWKKKAEDSTLALSRATPAKPTARELYLSAKMFRQEKEKAVVSGAISQPNADKAEKRFLGAADTNALTLSRDVTDADIALARGLDAGLEFFELIQGNTPGPKPGEQTAGQQLLELQRKAAGGEDDSAKARQEGQKEAETYQKQQLQARGLATA
jgi:hypothetical protein